MGCKRIYSVKENYFVKWNKNVAYILGFISADGSVNRNSLSIEIQIRDKEILKFIQKQISPKSPIKTINKKGRQYARLRINSIKLIESLKKYSIVPNKTILIKLNFNIPKKYLGDYLRGLFDGDGWVYVRRNSIERGIVSASKNYLYGIRNLVGNIGRTRSRRKTKKHKMLYYWEMGLNDTETLKKIMYSSKGFSLKRKRDILFSNYYIPSPKLWTIQQIRDLKKHYKPKTRGIFNKLTKIIGKSKKSISKKIWELGLAL